MALSYFGNLDSDDYWGMSASRTYYGIFNCTLSGSVEVKEISILSYYSATATIRLAVYNASGTTLICEGTSAVYAESTTTAWQGHMTQADITPNPATLTGGTNYILACSTENTLYARSYTDQGQTLDSDADAVYTQTGFPTDLGIAGYSDYYDLCLRCGVEAAAGGGATMTYFYMGLQRHRK